MHARRVAAHHPIATFLVLCYAINWAAILPPARTATDVLPLGLEGHESVGTLLGVTGAAFLVTAAGDGRDGVRDLACRSVRWHVGLGWYLLALFAMPAAVLGAVTVMYGRAPARALSRGGPELLTHTLPLLVLLIVLFNLPEEIGFTGFLQATTRNSLLIAGLFHASFSRRRREQRCRFRVCSACRAEQTRDCEHRGGARSTTATGCSSRVQPWPFARWA